MLGTVVSRDIGFPEESRAITKKRLINGVKMFNKQLHPAVFGSLCVYNVIAKLK